ncbi:MAG: exo-alpha-sialidase [Actinobacteria bacterium]|nr:exo-alpha-sialidase [Actinomycetota bacterium]
MRTNRAALAAAAIAAVTLVTACGSSGGKASDTKPTTSAAAPVTTTKASCKSSVPYTAGVGGYASYRIPATVVTGTGTVLAFAEGRRNGTSDAGDIDTVVRRSTDGGCTWSAAKVVTAVKGQNRNNPAPVYDPATRQVVLLTLGRPDTVTEAQIRGGKVADADSMRIYSQTSSDDGATFSAPTEITSQVKKPDWRWYAVGPGHGIVLTTGAHKGRIIFGANHSVTPPAGSTDDGSADKYLAANAIYSDDNAKTWHIGFVQENTDGVVNGNETTAAELPSGDVYFSTRNQNGSAPSHRAGGTSTDGGATLVSPLAPVDSLAQIPVIEASLLQPTGSASMPLLLSGPSIPNARKGMTIYASPDAGKTWKVAMSISEAPAAYSDLVQLDAHTIGLLYETGAKTENDTITFLRIPLTRIIG